MFKVILVFWLIFYFANSLKVYSNNSLVATYQSPVIRRFSPEVWSNFNCSISLDKENSIGDVILVQTYQGHSIEELVNLQISRSPKGLIIQSLVDGPAGTDDTLFNGISFHSGIVNIPTLELSKEDFGNLISIYNNYGNITVEMNSDDINPWLGYFGIASPYNITFRIVSFIWATINLILILTKYHKYGLPCKINLSRICLSIECLINIMKILWCIDPFGDPAQIYTWMIDNIFTTMPWSLSLLNTLLISLYWKEVIDKKNMSSKIQIIKRMRKPVLGVIIFFCIEETLFIILRSLYFDMKTLAYANGLGYVLVALGSSIVFIYISHKLKVELSIPGKHSALLNRISTNSILVAVGNLSFVACGTGLLSPNFWTPYTFYYVIFCMSICMNFVSTSQVMIFNPSGKKIKSSTNLDNTTVISGTSRLSENSPPSISSSISNQ